MKAGFTKFLLLFTLLFCSFGSFAKGFDFRVKAYNGSYLYFNIISPTDKTIELTFNNKKPSSYEGVVEIPDTIRYKNILYSVVAIGDSCFYNCYELYGVKIPSSVETIGKSAFDASRVKTIEIAQEGLKSIEEYAFRQCSQIQNIVFPNSLERIGKGAFMFCSALRDIVLPNKLKEIGVSAFYNCSMLFELSLPENLEYIGENAFYACENLQKITLNSYNCNLTNNFSNNNNIRSIRIANSVKSISEGAFAFNSALMEVEWESEECDYKGRVSIFEGCNSLSSISFSNNIKQIPNYLAKDCQGLKELTIPASTEKIGKDAFSNCFNLEKVYFNATNCKFDGVVFNNDTLLNEVIVGKNVKTIPDNFLNSCFNINGISIPETVVSIGEKAFKDCRKIKAINLSENIKSIGRDAFLGCDALESIHCKATSAPSVSGNLGWNDNTKIYIPCTYIYYYNNAEFWKEQRFECDTTVAVASKSESEEYDIDSKRNGETFYYKITSKSRRSISLVKYFSDGTTDEITIPSTVAWEGGTYTVTSISGNKVFEDVYTDIIDIPASVTSISTDAFVGIKSLRYINVDENNKAYCSDNGVLYNKDKSILLCHPTSSSAAFNIPQSVVSIESYAFGVARDNTLKSIRIPASVIAIGDNAFSACVGLKDINLDSQNNAYTFENGILYDKKKISIIAVCPAYFMNNEFTIGKNIKNIYNGAFLNWENLLTIICLGPTPANIGSETFNNVSTLSVIVPKNAYSKYKNANVWKDMPNLQYKGMKNSNKQR